jgi:predicted nuclease of predicted toxin-antitoxin system
MKILVDENIPRMTVEYLRTLGHDVKDVRGTSEQSLPDPDLWQVAISEGRLLVTTDKGFTSYRMARRYGILVVRLRRIVNPPFAARRLRGLQRSSQPA